MAHNPRTFPEVSSQGTILDTGKEAFFAVSATYTESRSFISTQYLHTNTLSSHQHNIQGVPYYWAHFVFVIFSGSRAHTEELLIFNFVPQRSLLPKMSFFLFNFLFDGKVSWKLQFSGKMLCHGAKLKKRDPT